MVLNMEHDIPVTTTSTSPSSVSTLSGTIDYTALVASQDDANMFMRFPIFKILKSHIPSSFFVTEAKVLDLSAHVPQAIAEMYACGKHLQKKILRGALTNGHDWIFLLLKFNNDDDGASYSQSDVIQMYVTRSRNDPPVVRHPEPDMIAAILLHWIRNSFVDLRSDDWFEAAPVGPVHM
jgi:hypothetical protein